MVQSTRRSRILNRIESGLIHVARLLALGVAVRTVSVRRNELIHKLGLLVLYHILGDAAALFVVIKGRVKSSLLASS